MPQQILPDHRSGHQSRARAGSRSSPTCRAGGAHASCTRSAERSSSCAPAAGSPKSSWGLRAACIATTSALWSAARSTPPSACCTSSPPASGSRLPSSSRSTNAKHDSLLAAVPDRTRTHDR